MEQPDRIAESSQLIAGRKNELYPKRVLDRAEKVASELSLLESGEVPIIELAAEDREEILRIEDGLGEKMENIFQITPPSVTFAPEYLLTSEGKQDFEETTGLTIPPDCTTAESIRSFIFLSREKIATLPVKNRDALANRSVKKAEESLIAALQQTLGEDGLPDFSNIPFPEKIILSLDPAESVKKVKRLLDFKKELKEIEKSIGGESGGRYFVLSGILRLYRKKINAMLVSLKVACFSLQKASAGIDSDFLFPEESFLLAAAVGTREPEKKLSRYDRFIHGTDKSKDGESKNEQQISISIRSYADEIERAFLENQLARTAALQKKGLDESFLSQENITPEQLKGFGDRVLAQYEILSDSPSEEYSSSDTGPAKDGKWRFVLSDQYRTFAVDGKRKVIKGPRKNFTVLQAIGTALAHEIEGHVLQHENRSQVELRLFKKTGSSRSDVLAECGAMHNEALVSREIIGTGSEGHPHYLRAMAKKLEGGNYFDCVRVFQESALKGDRIRLSLGEISPEEFQARAKKSIALATNRAKRLFHGAADFSSNQPFLTKSKDTAYAEQIKVYQEFKRRGLEKYVYMSGADIDDIPFLIQSGLMKSDAIKQPLFYSLKIWEELKKVFALDKKTLDENS